MYTPYTFMFYLIFFFFISIINSVDQQLHDLFGIISRGKNVITLDDLAEHTELDESNFVEMIEEYGTHVVENDTYEMNFEQFKKATAEGDIPRFSIERMLTLFKEIIPEDASRKFIILKDLFQYYCRSPNNLTGELIDNVWIFYSTPQDERGTNLGIDFRHFKRALNLYYLPDPPPI